MSDYYAIKALSHSKISCLAQNPMEFKMRYVDDPPTLPPKESDAFAMGHAVHCLALEPEKFDERFVVTPKIDRRTKEGKLQAIIFERDNEGKIVLTLEEYQDAIACVQALNNHAEFATIMAQPRRVEVPFEFDSFGHRFKAKPDCIVDSMRLIVDIKTTDDASHKWLYSAKDLGYHRQAFIYQHALSLETGIAYNFIFAVVEKPKPSTRGIPPRVALHRVAGISFERGKEHTRDLVEEYEKRLERGDWIEKLGKGINDTVFLTPTYEVYE
jgi:exodeoxyribonuclease VIII